jgi:hypothetical protein
LAIAKDILGQFPLDATVICKLNAGHRNRAVRQNVIRGIVLLTMGGAWAGLFACGYWRLGLILLLSGGIGLAFGTARLVDDRNLLRKGMLIKPRERWRAQNVGSCLEVQVGRTTYSAPFTELRGATLITEASFESFTSLVDALVLHFIELPDLAVPCSGTGCSELIELLFRRGQLQRVDV